MPGEHIDRIIGLGGDRIKCCDTHGHLLLNGKTLVEPYLAKGSRAAPYNFSVSVPKRHLWLMGDNRGVAFDSLAAHLDPGGGFVAADRVTGGIRNSGAACVSLARTGSVPTHLRCGLSADVAEMRGKSVDGALGGPWVWRRLGPVMVGTFAYI